MYDPIIRELVEFLEYMFADKQKRKVLNNVPRYCQQCELPGICRDEDKDWKCGRGCLLMHDRQKSNK